MEKKWEYEKPSIEIKSLVEDLIKTSLGNEETGPGGSRPWTWTS